MDEWVGNFLFESFLRTPRPGGSICIVILEVTVVVFFILEQFFTEFE